MDAPLQETKVEKAPPHRPNLDPGLYGVVTSALWFLLVAFVFGLLRRQLGRLIDSVTARVRAGASLKVAAFEIGALPYVPGGQGDTPKVRGVISVTPDTDGKFDAQRQQFRGALRNLFLVHKLAPSSDPEQLYDVVIYLVPSLRYGSLAGVNAVEYYFGRYWQRNVFRSIDRATGFLIATSAYAPFTCTARVEFTDGEEAFLHRYVDFEMGQLPTAARIPRKADA